MMVALVGFSQSCKKEQMVTKGGGTGQGLPTKTLSASEIPISDGSEYKPTILGAHLNNPYAVTNMTQALRNLTGEGTCTLPTTDLYVRFLPEDVEQIKQLEDDGIDLSEKPYDYEVVEYGDYYQDPSIPIDQITWLYAVVKPNYQFRSKITYQILANLYLPVDGAIIEGCNGSIEAEKLETEALIISGNTDDVGDTTSTRSARKVKKYKPQGFIRVDNLINGADIDVGVRG